MSNMFLLQSSLAAVGSISVKEGLIYSVISIAIVFSLLVLIIGITSIISVIIKKAEKNRNSKNNNTQKKSGTVSAPQKAELDTGDEDMMAAVLVATVDYRNETKKSVKLLNVRKVN